MKALIDNKDPSNNEFFRIKKIFDDLVKDPKHSDLLKLEILMKKAQELYDYLQKTGILVKEVEVYRYKPGAIEPELTNKTVAEAIKEADRAFNIFHDYDIAKENYNRIINVYDRRLRQFSVYEPFFDHIMNLMSRLQVKFKDIKMLDELAEEKKKLLNEMELLKKEKNMANEKAKINNEEINRIKEEYEKIINEMIANISLNNEKLTFMATLPQWKKLNNENFYPVIKMISYGLIKNVDKLTVEEVADTLDIKTTKWMGNTPFIEYDGKGYFLIKWDKLLPLVDKEQEYKKIAEKEKKGWFEIVKEKFKRIN